MKIKKYLIPTLSIASMPFVASTFSLTSCSTNENNVSYYILSASANKEHDCTGTYAGSIQYNFTFDSKQTAKDLKVKSATAIISGKESSYIHIVQCSYSEGTNNSLTVYIDYWYSRSVELESGKYESNYSIKLSGTTDEGKKNWQQIFDGFKISFTISKANNI